MAEKSQKISPAPPLVGVELNPGPGRGKKWDEETRWRAVLKWKDEKKGSRKIAKELEISRSGVDKLIQKYQETGTVHDRPKSGRKRKLSTAEVKKAVKKAKSGKAAPEIARDISKMKEKKTSQVSARTVERRLKEQGLRSSRSGKSSLQTKFKRDLPTRKQEIFLTGSLCCFRMKSRFGLALESTSSGKTPNTG